MTSTHFAVAPSILNRSYWITAEIEVPQGGANGVLVTQGGRFTGYAFYLKEGRPTFVINLIGIERPKWQSSEALPPGKHTVVFDWKMDSQRSRKAGGARFSGPTMLKKESVAETLTSKRFLLRSNERRP